MSARQVSITLTNHQIKNETYGLRLALYLDHVSIFLNQNVCVKNVGTGRYYPILNGFNNIQVAGRLNILVLSTRQTCSNLPTGLKNISKYVENVSRAFQCTVNYLSYQVLCNHVMISGWSHQSALHQNCTIVQLLVYQFIQKSSMRNLNSKCPII